MKELLTKNKSSKIVFSTILELYLISDKENKIVSHMDYILSSLDISKSTVYRVISEIKSVGFSAKIEHNYLKICFKKEQNKRKTRNDLLLDKSDSLYYEKLYLLLETFYKEKNYVYTTINKPLAIKLDSKLEQLMIAKNLDINFESKLDSFTFFLYNLPEFWLEKGLLSLSTLNKHFEKIINGIKTNKNDKYNDLRQKSAGIDFDEIANGGQEVHSDTFIR